MPNAALLDRTYLRHGIQLTGNEMTVDLAEPRTVIVRGFNSKTGEAKDYLLRVTQSGRLVLQ